MLKYSIPSAFDWLGAQMIPNLNTLNPDNDMNRQNVKRESKPRTQLRNEQHSDPHYMRE